MNKRRTNPIKPLADPERQVAEAAAHVIAKAEEVGLPDPPEKLVTPNAIRLLARSYVELRDAVRALHDLVDQTDPHDPIGVALTKVDLARRPPDWSTTEPRLARAPAEIAALTTDQLIAIYCHTMRDVAEVFVKYETYIVRHWDGMDGCWTDCTGDVGREEALRAWADRTDGGTHHVTYDGIDYYRIFPGGTRMHWDGSDGKEMHR